MKYESSIGFSTIEGGVILGDTTNGPPSAFLFMFCLSLLNRWIELEPNLNRFLDGFLAQATTGEGRSCSDVGVASADGRPDREGICV